MFYVYEWFIKETNEIIYVGKGCGNRYKSTDRNNLFKECIKNFECDSRIIKYYEVEDEAFCAEEKRIKELKDIGQASCNIYTNGRGGLNSFWTEENRKWMSENNPMKAEEQRKRMSENNPMKNKEVAKKVALKKSKPVVLNGVEYKGTIFASEQTGFASASIKKWCERGYDNNGNPCRYKDEEQKSYTFKKGNYKVSKKVWIDEMLFDSVKEASIYCNPHTNKTSSQLIHCLKNNKQYKGFKVKYDNQQPS